jgi:hypothetical protein
MSQLFFKVYFCWVMVLLPKRKGHWGLKMTTLPLNYFDSFNGLNL